MPRNIASRKVIIGGVAVSIVIIGLLVAVIVLSSKENDDNPKPDVPTVAEQDFLSHYNVNDGIDVTWYNGTLTSVDDIQAIVKGDFDVLEIDLIGTPNKVVVRQTPITLTEVLRSLTPTNTAVKLDLVSVSSFNERIMDLIRIVDGSGFTNPTIVSVPVISNVIMINISRFISDANDYRPKSPIILNFDLTSVCCDSQIGKGLIEYIDYLVGSVDYSVSVEVDAHSIQTSWADLKWLLEKHEKLVLIVSVNNTSNTVLKFDILLARNDIHKSRILYNLGTLSNEFHNLAGTGGSPLNYFDINPRDAGKIIWSHNTDTWGQLDTATKGDTMMIEGDIQMFGQGTANQTDLPVMAHDAGDYNNITFEQWLDEIIKVHKGMKFDFKSIDAVKPALDITNSRKHLIAGPIWLNADILQGPGAGPPRIPAQQFLQDIQTFPDATLSLGWTTVAKGDNYNLSISMDMAKQMNDICKDLPQPVTFPTRAEQFVHSWKALDWLLSQSRGYTITVWTAPTDNVTKADMDLMKRLGEQSRIYFDLPKELRPSF